LLSISLGINYWLTGNSLSHGKQDCYSLYTDEVSDDRLTSLTVDVLLSCSCKGLLFRFSSRLRHTRSTVLNEFLFIQILYCTVGRTIPATGHSISVLYCTYYYKATSSGVVYVCMEQVEEIFLFYGTINSSEKPVITPECLYAHVEYKGILVAGYYCT
jgi:hypothetical protein